MAIDLSCDDSSMSDYRDTSEDAAARAVVGVLGGEYEINDTGSEPGQYDVRIVTRQGRTVAMEATSFGGDDWKRTRARIQAEQERGHLAGEGLRHQWWVVFPTGIDIRNIGPPLNELLSRLEQDNEASITSRYEGSSVTLNEVAAKLRDLRVNSASVWVDSPPEGQPRILL
jgi:hypothetical protein